MKLSYHGGCFFSQKYPFDDLLFTLRTSDVYKASVMLIPPQGRGKQNSHFGIQNEKKLTFLLHKKDPAHHF